MVTHKKPPSLPSSQNASSKHSPAPIFFTERAPPFSTHTHSRASRRRRPRRRRTTVVPSHAFLALSLSSPLCSSLFSPFPLKPSHGAKLLKPHHGTRRSSSNLHSPPREASLTAPWCAVISATTQQCAFCDFIALPLWYKVIASVKKSTFDIDSLRSNPGWPKIETKIYSFGSNSCTVIQNQNFPRFWTRKLGIFVSGTLNWIVKRGESDDQWMILSLDIVTEIFGEVFLPEVDEDGDTFCDPALGVSRNCLCVCFFDSKNAHWTVMLMKEYGVRNSWIKLVMTPHIDLLRPHQAMFQPLYISEDISENGVVLLRTTKRYGISKRNRIFLYNSNDGRLVYPRIRDKLQFDMHIYFESLVSPEC